jgi:hypothetical protein
VATLLDLSGVDTDRELAEIDALVNEVKTRVMVDTGDANGLVLFASFIDAHPGLIPTISGDTLVDRGIGGSVSGIGATVADVQLGPYHLHNRYANLMHATSGAFADQNDGGNVGYGTLDAFVTSFAITPR